jgi:small subunit ribosomal protein S4e
MSHLKRLAAPKTWNISRKDNTFIVTPNPGPHKKEHSIPLVVLIRDMIGIVDNAKECKNILHTGQVLINGRKRRENNYPVGLMDIIELPLTKKSYKLMISTKGKLFAKELEKSEDRMCRIEGKTILANKKVQLNLFGGENIIIDKDEYKVGDTIKLDVKDRKVKGSVVLSKGVPALIIGGSHVGEIAVIKGIDKSIAPTEIILEDESQKEIRTRLYNVYPIEQK